MTPKEMVGGGKRRHSCFAGTRTANRMAGYRLRLLLDFLAIEGCSTMGLERQMKYFGLALALLLAACTSSVKLGPQTVAGLAPDGTVDMNEVQAAFIGSAGAAPGLSITKGFRMHSALPGWVLVASVHPRSMPMARSTSCQVWQTSPAPTVKHAMASLSAP